MRMISERLYVFRQRGRLEPCCDSIRAGVGHRYWADRHPSTGTRCTPQDKGVAERQCFVECRYPCQNHIWR